MKLVCSHDANRLPELTGSLGRMAALFLLQTRDLISCLLNPLAVLVTRAHVRFSTS